MSRYDLSLRLDRYVLDESMPFEWCYNRIDALRINRRSKFDWIDACASNELFALIEWLDALALTDCMPFVIMNLYPLNDSTIEWMRVKSIDVIARNRYALCINRFPMTASIKAGAWTESMRFQWLFWSINVFWMTLDALWLNRLLWGNRFALAATTNWF